MEFSPAEVDGKPSPIRIEFTIHFLPGRLVAPAPDGGAPRMPPAPTRFAPEAAPSRPPPAARRGRRRARARARKGTREPLVGADVAVIAPPGRQPRPSDGQAEVVGATDDDGRFEVRAASRGRFA